MFTTTTLLIWEICEVSVHWALWSQMDLRVILIPTSSSFSCPMHTANVCMDSSLAIQWFWSCLRPQLKGHGKDHLPELSAATSSWCDSESRYFGSFSYLLYLNQLKQHLEQYGQKNMYHLSYHFHYFHTLSPKFCCQVEGKWGTRLNQVEGVWP
jgi:hypothetical protein